MECVSAITALIPGRWLCWTSNVRLLEAFMKVIFFVSGLLAGGLGFVIFFSSRATQEIEGLMLFLIGTVFSSVVVMMDTISGAQSETTVLLRELLEATRQRRQMVQDDPTGSGAEPADESQPESQTEHQVA